MKITYIHHQTAPREPGDAKWHLESISSHLLMQRIMNDITTNPHLSITTKSFKCVLEYFIRKPFVSSRYNPSRLGVMSGS